MKTVLVKAVLRLYEGCMKTVCMKETWGGLGLEDPRPGMCLDLWELKLGIIRVHRLRGNISIRQHHTSAYVNKGGQSASCLYEISFFYLFYSFYLSTHIMSAKRNALKLSGG